MEALLPGDPESVGPYRLEARLGAGGMGQVYLGRSPGGRKVAVKVIRAEHAADPLFRQRFAREIDAARRVGGFHTAPIVAADPEADPPWMTTAYIDGPSLLALVRADGPLPVARCIVLARELAEGLAAIHACDLVHRDLKPGNVLIAADGARIIDFGITRAADAGSLTSTGVAIGTFAYMSPEQVLAEPVRPASDVFSLGAVLAYAATGRGPFDADSIPAIVQKIMNTEPDLAGVDDPLRAVVASCLAKAPEDRPTAAEVLSMLDVAAEPESESELGPEPEREPEPESDVFPEASAAPNPTDVHAAITQPESAVLADPAAVPTAVPAAVPAATAPPSPAEQRRKTSGRKVALWTAVGVLMVGGAATGIYLATKSPDRTVPGTAASNPPTGAGSPGPVDWSTVTSAQSGGGMNALIAAAKSEGSVKVMTLSAANYVSEVDYGTLMNDFSREYGITVNWSQEPSDNNELVAIVNSANSAAEADAVDIGSPLGASSADLFADYEVADWPSIPAASKDPNGEWYADPVSGSFSSDFDQAICKNAPHPAAARLWEEFLYSSGALG